MKSKLIKKSALIDLAARVAHDMRSPIAIMEMSLRNLDENKADLSMLRLAIQRLRDMANNMLDEYRSDNDSDSVLLTALLEQVVYFKRYEWSERSCELSLFLNAIPSSLRIFGDINEIKCMLSNLLNNAIEACQFNAVIQLRADKFEDAVVVTISDNGVGVPAEKIEKYFNGESSKHRGPGLGLSRAKQYMESIDGGLSLVSQPGVGTRIALKFRIDSK